MQLALLRTLKRFCQSEAKKSWIDKQEFCLSGIKVSVEAIENLSGYRNRQQVTKKRLMICLKKSEGGRAWINFVDFANHINEACNAHIKSLVAHSS